MTMKIQVNTDRNVDGSDAVVLMVENQVHATLSHHEDRLTRVEVYLREADGKTSGMECLIEARPAGMGPVVVTGVGGTPEQACHDAAGKMSRLLQSTFGRIDGRDGDATIRQAETP